MKQNNNKIKSKKGFTLTEMLATVLIMSLVMTVVANGMSHIKDIYEKTIEKSDAQMLLSTAEEQLRDELEFACEVKVIKIGEVDTVYYRKSDSYVWNSINMNGCTIDYYDSNVIEKIASNVTEDNKPTPLNGTPEPLVRVDTNRTKLTVKFKRITYAGGKFTVENLRVEDSLNHLLAGGEESNKVNVVVRPVNTVNEVE